MFMSEAKELLERWRRRILPEWEIQVRAALPEHLEDVGPESHAYICLDDERRFAWVWLNPISLDRPHAEVEQVLVHELLHAVLRDTAVVADILENEHGPAGQALAARYRHAEEEAIWRLAKVLVCGSMLDTALDE